MAPHVVQQLIVPNYIILSECHGVSSRCSLDRQLHAEKRAEALVETCLETQTRNCRARERIREPFTSQSTVLKRWQEEITMCCVDRYPDYGQPPENFSPNFCYIYT